MAEMDSNENVSFSEEEFVFDGESDIYSLDLYEEVVGDIEVEQDEIIKNNETTENVNNAQNLPEVLDPMDLNQWEQEEVNDPSELISCEDTEVQAHVYECYKCAKHFNNKDKLCNHMKLHHDKGDDIIMSVYKNIWACTQCDKTFISRTGSLVHQRTHTGEKPYLCSLCLKGFIDNSTLMKHKVIHQLVRPYSCLICRKGFNQRVSLRRHEKLHQETLHQKKEQPQSTYKCKFCPKTFLIAKRLYSHEKIHFRIKTYTCRYCPNRFDRYALRTAHEKEHTNACHYGPEAFKDSGALFKAPTPLQIESPQTIQTTSMKQPKTLFYCERCNESFLSRNTLIFHIKDHTGERPCPCKTDEIS